MADKYNISELKIKETPGTKPDIIKDSSTELFASKNGNYRLQTNEAKLSTI